MVIQSAVIPTRVVSAVVSNIYSLSWCLIHLYVVSLHAVSVSTLSAMACGYNVLCHCGCVVSHVITITVTSRKNRPHLHSSAVIDNHDKLIDLNLCMIFLYPANPCASSLLEYICGS